MNATQLKYARERVKKMYATKCNEISSRHQKSVVILSPKKRLEALKAGAYEFRKPSEVGNGWGIENFVKFNAETLRDTDTEKAEVLALKNKFESCFDQLILGDNEQALALLAAFEAA